MKARILPKENVLGEIEGFSQRSFNMAPNPAVVNKAMKKKGACSGMSISVKAFAVISAIPIKKTIPTILQRKEILFPPPKISTCIQ